MMKGFISKVFRHCAHSFLMVFKPVLSDKNYYRIQYYVMLGRIPNIDNPSLYTEKLQWLKLYDHNPLYTKIVDKFEVKRIISSIIGEQYVIPTLGIWNSPEEVNIETLPNQFVLKTTFGGGGDGIVICRDKTKLNREETLAKLKKSFNTNPYLRAREWPYRDVPRRIIAEQYLEDDSGELRDYKFYCFGGKPHVVMIASNRFTNHYFNYFDMDFNILPITSAMGTHSNAIFDKPMSFNEMKEVATKLSKGFTHVRVDLYSCQGKVYFGELTLYDSSGFDDLSSEEWNQRFGDWISLPQKENSRTDNGLSGQDINTIISENNV